MDKQRVNRSDPVRPTWAVGRSSDTVVVYLIINDHDDDKDDDHDDAHINAHDEDDHDDQDDDHDNEEGNMGCW